MIKFSSFIIKDFLELSNKINSSEWVGFDSDNGKRVISNYLWEDSSFKVIDSKLKLVNDTVSKTKLDVILDYFSEKENNCNIKQIFIFASFEEMISWLFNKETK